MLALFAVATFYSCSSNDEPTNPNAPQINSVLATNTTSTSTTIIGEITAAANTTVAQSGICYRTTANPTIEDEKILNASPTGQFTTTLTGLTSNTHYYARVYAIVGSNVYYSNNIHITTLE